MQAQSAELAKHEASQILQKLRLSVLHPHAQRRAAFEEWGYRFLDDNASIEKIMTEVPAAASETFAPEIAEALEDGRMKIGVDASRTYVYIARANPPFMILTQPRQDDFGLFISVGVLFGGLLLLLYFSIVHSLLPLKRLAQAIRRYGETGTYFSSPIRGNDEIAYVGRAFDEAVRKNRALMEARHLFLRNVMHELKTPITSGKIAIAMIEDGREKEILDRSYRRLEHLIAEMARVEQVTSQLLKPEMESVSVEMIVYQVLQELLIDDEHIVCSNLKGCYVQADEGMIYAVFKNMIDNAMKYASGGVLEIVREGDRLIFINEAESWPEERSFAAMLEPFVHQNGPQRTRSFGLGLYIVNAMLRAQGFTFTHEYLDGNHLFSVGGLTFEACDT